MSFKKQAAFSLILGVLIVGIRLPGSSGRSIPLLEVEGLRAASTLTARGEARSVGTVKESWPEDAMPLYTDPDDQFSKDPAIIQHDGKYYMYYFGFTKDGREAIKCASSTDLARWRYEGAALAARRDGAWDSDLIWAADVVYRNGLFYLYYTGGRADPHGDIDWATMRIGLAVSRDPKGAFVRYAQNPVLTPPFGNGVIDADFFADDDGKDYLYYAVQTSAYGHWEGIRVQKADGMTSFSGDQSVIEPTAGWEDNVVEAPTVFKANGYYYLLYSGGKSDIGQRIGYAFSRTPTSRFGGSEGWTKYPDNGDPRPLIDHNPVWADFAVGSTTLTLGPNHQIYVLFQGKSGMDGRFRLGMTRLLLDGSASPARLSY